MIRPLEIVVRVGDLLNDLLVSRWLVQVLAERGHDDFRSVALFDLSKYVDLLDEFSGKIEVDALGLVAHVYTTPTFGTQVAVGVTGVEGTRSSDNRY